MTEFDFRYNYRKANGLAESVAHALSVALPMVKGYAAEHRVGRNEELALWVADRLQDWIDAGYAVRALSNARGSEHTESRPKCDGCGNEIDPDVCWCGETIDGRLHDNHIAIPMGCKCAAHPQESEQR